MGRVSAARVFPALLCVAALILSACSGSQGGAVPAGSSAGSQFDSTIQTTPVPNAQATPAHDSPHGLPGGENPPCASLLSLVTCSVVVNMLFPPLKNPLTPQSLIPGYHPSDLQSAYNLPSAMPGTKIAVIVAYDDPGAEVDLTAYRTVFGLPLCPSLTGCFQKVNQIGQAGPLPAINTAWSIESALDVDMVSAGCPNCSILLVEANSASLKDLGDAVDTAVRLGAHAVSNSYYANEFPQETALDVHFNHPGVAITASSGDSALPSYPAASKYVTGVGGTTLSNAGGTWKEKPWLYGGRGCSVYVARPPWQPLNLCPVGRSVVDVATVGDPMTGVAMFDALAGGWLVAGGTSVGAPLIADAYALSGQFSTPAALYSHRAAFNDVPPLGIDLITGLGTPRGTAGF